MLTSWASYNTSDELCLFYTSTGVSGEIIKRKEQANMPICTFFGHRICPDKIKPILHSILVDVIESEGESLFYVGNQGDFDYKVLQELQALVKIYPHVKYRVVLAYVPGEKKSFDLADDLFTIIPEGIESTTSKYAISKRNMWMLTQADIVITYCVRAFGGAAKFVDIAKSKGKRIINIADYMTEI